MGQSRPSAIYNTSVNLIGNIDNVLSAIEQAIAIMIIKNELLAAEKVWNYSSKSPLGHHKYLHRSLCRKQVRRYIDT